MEKPQILRFEIKKLAANARIKISALAAINLK